MSATDSCVSLKEQFRQKSRKSLQGFLPSQSAQSLKERVAANIDFLLSKIVTSKDEVWASYQPLKSEIDPTGAKSISDWAYPKVHGEDLAFYKSNDFESGSFGVVEPIDSSSMEVNKQDINGFLVPGVAYDRFGQRLGKGKGYYDRALEGLSAIKVGLTYSILFFDEIPTEKNDVSMDYIVSEDFVYSVEDRKFLKGQR